MIVTMTKYRMWQKINIKVVQLNKLKMILCAMKKVIGTLILTVPIPEQNDQNENCIELEAWRDSCIGSIWSCL